MARARSTSARKPAVQLVGASRGARISLRSIALLYLFLLLALPLGLILYQTFENGIQPVIDALTEPNAVHALKVTLQVSIAASTRSSASACP